jgi:hypothetical protein
MGYIGTQPTNPLNDGAVTSAKIADSTIVAADIAADALLLLALSKLPLQGQHLTLPGYPLELRRLL